MFKIIFDRTVEKCKKNLIVITFMVFSYVLLYYFRNRINKLINEYLTVEKTWSNIFFDLTLLIISIILLYYFGKKIIKNRYLYSYNQFFVLIASLCFLTIFSFVDTEWEYSNLFYGYRIFFPHITIFFVALSVFLIIGIRNYFIPEKPKTTTLIFKEDNSLNNKENDILNYTHIVTNLKDKLIVQDFTKSFTVGIIGPWGNGKSSFISLLKEQLKNEKEIILVTFLPYLNHTESEISSEFFHSFQTALQPYSGKLSNLILEYSNKLLNLYNNNKGLGNFMKSDISNFNSTSANDTYETINEALGEINKKIIVFVDDLDRLNHEEILQVLKLIRNTANFKNTIFIVAMDKGYILNRLNNSEAILDNRFIDKFFQLEIYLPEIDNSILVDEFKNILNNSLIFSEQIKIEFDNIINQNKILFIDYIKNLRDVKRVCNQIIFEYEFINEEIKLEDFINFILLKLSFPEFISKLKSNPLLYLEKFDNYYRLKKAPDQNGDDGLFNIYLETISKQEFKKYELYNQFFKEDEICRDEISKLICDQKITLIKTLISLFGDVNDLTPNSIKFENNFRRFMQLNYNGSDFLNKNFIEIIEKTDVNLIKTDIELITSNSQQIELLDRIKYFSPKTSEELKTTIVIYGYLLENIDKNKLTEFEILRSLGAFCSTYIVENKNGEINVFEISHWFIDEIINSEKFNIKTQLKLIGSLWGLNDSGKLWEIETSRLEEVLLKKFKAYLEIHNQKLWEVNDYTFYRIYHEIKIIASLKSKLIEEFISFLSKNEIYTFCVQSTDYDSFEDNVYKITDTVVEFFGSKENYSEFIKKHKDSNKLEIIEYLNFLELFKITKFSIPIVYEFKETQAFNLKREHLRLINGGSLISDKKESKFVQMFLKVKNESEFNSLAYVRQFDNSIYRISDLKFFIYEGKFYILLMHYYGTDTRHNESYMLKIYEHLKTIFTEGLILNGLKIEHNQDVIIDVYSIQPK